MKNLTVDEVAGMYYRYRKTDDDQIRDLLKDVKLVKLTNKGKGTIHGYYEIVGEKLEELKEDPRGKSLTFHIYDDEGKAELGSEPLELYEIFKLKFLVKSSSRFFYKPDIGEIVDQIPYLLKHSDVLKAINVDCSDYTHLGNTDGEHFVCQVELLTDESGRSEIEWYKTKYEKEDY